MSEFRTDSLTHLNMADLNKEIIDLKEEIGGYKAEYKNATSVEEKQRISDLINSARETLNRLLDEKKDQTSATDG